MLAVPSVVLQNAMACKVFRLLKLGIIEEDPTKTITGLLFKTTSDGPRNTSTFASTQGSSRTDNEIGLSTISSTPTKHEGRDTPMPLRIAVRKDVDIDVDDDASGRQEWKRVNLV